MRRIKHTLSMPRVILCLYLDNIAQHKFSCCSILALSSLHVLARGGLFAYFTRQNRPELALSAPPNSDAKKEAVCKIYSHRDKNFSNITVLIFKNFVIFCKPRRFAFILFGSTPPPQKKTISAFISTILTGTSL